MKRDRMNLNGALQMLKRQIAAGAPDERVDSRLQEVVDKAKTLPESLERDEFIRQCDALLDRTKKHTVKSA
jgi:hypothetical protein